MKILLIDIDSKIPNIALMKISAYHRREGDLVGFNIANPDKIYASVIFNKNRHKVDGLRFMYPNTEIDIGGTGRDLFKQLPSEIEQCTPDYDLYQDCDSFYGFTTRGCIRDCHFCVVPRKEGKFRRVYNTPQEAIDSIIGDNVGRFRNITLMDNNILADKEWFMGISEQILERKLKVDFNQGLDIRLLDDEIAGRLKEMKPIVDWKFAFDSIVYQKHVLKGIEILQAHDIDTKNKCLFYVYCDGDYAVPDAVERCRILKEHHATAYSMLNRDCVITPRMRALARWTRPWLFWSIDYDSYNSNNVINVKSHQQLPERATSWLVNR